MMSLPEILASVKHTWCYKPLGDMVGSSDSPRSGREVEQDDRWRDFACS
jgi:hypothetical protein